MEVRKAQPAGDAYQLPEAVMFARILTAQDICQQTVHFTHVQSDPVKQVKEKSASWEKRLLLHTKTSASSAANSTFPLYIQKM